MWACRPRTSRPAGGAALGRLRQERQRDAELRVLLAGGDLVVGVGPDPGGGAEEDALRAPGDDPLEARDLVEGVDDDVADAGIDGLLEFSRALVVAVHVDPRGVEAGVQRQVQLAARGDVAGKALLGEQAQGGGAGEGLAREDDLEVVRALGECRLDGAGAGAHVVLRVDVCGRAELGRELDHVAAAHLESAALVDAAALRVDRRARDRVGQGLSTLRHETGIVTVGAGSPTSRRGRARR